MKPIHITDTEQKQIIALIQREVVPAIGCTEPMAVALCVAQATRMLGTLPDRIEAKLSANILKNAMGVGIPGTDQIGLPIAIALGAIAGNPDYKLEVLKDITPADVEKGKKYISENRIKIDLEEQPLDKLYVAIECTKGSHRTKAVIAYEHTSFVYLEHDGRVEKDQRERQTADEDEAPLQLNMRKVYDFAMTTPLERIRFILEAKELNKAAAEHSLKRQYGHQLGNIIRNCKGSDQVMGDSTFTHVLSYTSAACDARMGGALIPVMSNSGSGNQGITATLPVVVYAEDHHKSEEQLIRALTLSHLTAIYIKQSLGRLSALCGCVVAATGSSCGITYLMGGNYKQITYAVQNMIANLTGMICDGAKPSCAMKLTSGVSTAMISAIMAMNDQRVTSVEGIIDDDVDKSIRNLTKIGSEGMNETDRLVLHIMTHKGC